VDKKLADSSAFALREGWPVKHYLYTLFPDTAMQTVQHYVYKYGSDAAVREMLTHDPFFEANIYDYQNARLVRTPLRAGAEAHDDVVIHGRWCNANAKPLAKVKPWDMLLLLGHGQEREQVRQNQDGSRTVVGRTFNPHICRSDDSNQTQTVANVVSGLGPDQDALSKDHVLFKMVMCFSGGAYRQQTPSDCFAKLMAVALANAGWENAIVAGYKGEVRAANDHFDRLSRPKRTSGTGPNREVGQIDIVPRAKMVVDWDGQNPIPAKENLFYFHGRAGDTVDETTVKLVKRILWGFPADQSTAVRKNYHTAIVTKLNQRDPTRLGAGTVTGKVLRMLKKHLG
jgi:hypothetical protein